MVGLESLAHESQGGSRMHLSETREPGRFRGKHVKPENEPGRRPCIEINPKKQLRHVYQILLHTDWKVGLLSLFKFPFSYRNQSHEIFSDESFELGIKALIVSLLDFRGGDVSFWGVDILLGYSCVWEGNQELLLSIDRYRIDNQGQVSVTICRPKVTPGLSIPISNCLFHLHWDH